MRKGKLVAQWANDRGITFAYSEEKKQLVVLHGSTEPKMLFFTLEGKCINKVNLDKHQATNVPTNVALWNENIYMTDFFNSQILVYNWNMEKKTSIKTQAYPKACCLSENKICYITNENLCILSESGQLIQNIRIARPGNQITFHNGLVYIPQPTLSSVHIWSDDGIFVKSWKEYGHRKKPFGRPIAVTNQNDLVYVLDTWNTFTIPVFNVKKNDSCVFRQNDVSYTKAFTSTQDYLILLSWSPLPNIAVFE